MADEAAAQRDAIGALLDYRQKSTGTWEGTCADCGDTRAMVSSTGWSCPTCGTRTRDAKQDLVAMDAEDRDPHAVIERLSGVHPEPLEKRGRRAS